MGAGGASARTPPGRSPSPARPPTAGGRPTPAGGDSAFSACASMSSTVHCGRRSWESTHTPNSSSVMRLVLQAQPHEVQVLRVPLAHVVANREHRHRRPSIRTSKHAPGRQQQRGRRQGTCQHLRRAPVCAGSVAPAWTATSAAPGTPTPGPGDRCAHCHRSYRAPVMAPLAGTADRRRTGPAPPVCCRDRGPAAAGGGWTRTPPGRSCVREAAAAAVRWPPRPVARSRGRRPMPRTARRSAPQLRADPDLPGPCAGAMKRPTSWPTGKRFMCAPPQRRVR